MVRPSVSAAAQIGRLATPPPEVLGTHVVGKAKDFFREICRLVPWTVRNYRLDELCTAAELRSNIALLFRHNGGVKDPKVVDILIYKGREELESVALQHKQRHHLITYFIEEPRTVKAEAATRAQNPRSQFLANFYGAQRGVLN